MPNFAASAKSRAAEKLGERLAAVQQAAEELRGKSRLTDLLGTEEIVLDNDVPALVALLGEAINQAGEEKNALQIITTTDQRVLDALGSGGLLPPSDHIADALDVLASENITAWSGWEYLSKIRTDERNEVLARYPYLVDGIVLNSGDDLNRAQEKLTEARLLPRAVIAVGTPRQSRTLMLKSRRVSGSSSRPTRPCMTWSVPNKSASRSSSGSKHAVSG